MENNYAFVDGQNIYLGIIYQGWQLDLRKFRIYLKDKFKVKKAYYFIGYIPKYINLYKEITRTGFIVKFRRVSVDKNGDTKGNVDSELIFNSMYRINNYDKAVIVAGDADYYCLIKYLNFYNKLEKILIPDRIFCPKVYKNNCFNKYLMFLNDLEQKVSK